MPAHLELLAAGGGGEPSRFICGYLACDRHLSQSFLSGLPPLIRVNIRDDPSGQWLEQSLRFSVTQAASSDAGTHEVVSKLSEVFFAEALRRYQRELPPGNTGWLAGAREPAVGRALMLIHHIAADGRLDHVDRGAVRLICSARSYETQATPSVRAATGRRGRGHCHDVGRPSGKVRTTG